MDAKAKDVTVPNFAIFFEDDQAFSHKVPHRQNFTKYPNPYNNTSYSCALSHCKLSRMMQYCLSPSFIK
jgi:hypothetical protein